MMRNEAPALPDNSDSPQRALTAPVVDSIQWELGVIDEDDQSRPVVAGARQHLDHRRMGEGILGLDVAVINHALKMGVERDLALAEGHTVLRGRQALVIEGVQRTDMRHPGQRPGVLLRVAARQGQKIPG